MATIDKIINSLNNTDPEKVVFEVLRQDQNYILQLNKDQLLRGEVSDGGKTPEHTYGPMSAIYVREKLSMGRIKNSTLPNMNFFNKGDFFRGFKAKFQGLSFSNYSTDSKSGEIQGMTDNKVFGLQKESIDLLITREKPAIISTYRKKLGI